MNETFPREILDAAAREPAVTLTTRGRKTGKPRRVTIGVSSDGTHVYIRSGDLRRNWAQNLMASGEATLHLRGKSVPVRPRYVSEPDEVRAVSHLYRDKYGFLIKPSKPGEPLTTDEKATFELLPS